MKTSIFIEALRDSLKNLTVENINEDSIKRLSNQIGNISSDILMLKRLFRELKHYKPFWEEYEEIEQSIDNVIHKYAECHSAKMNKKKTEEEQLISEIDVINT